MKYYIYTIPKAGTYLLAKALSTLGIHDTGYHLNVDTYLDTKQFTQDVNRITPSETQKRSWYPNTLEQVPDNGLCFGHLAPLFFPFRNLHKYHIIMSIRSPKEVLVSEYIDFRFRRADVEWVSKTTIPDDEQAFETYLERAIPIFETLFNKYFTFRNLLNNWLYRQDFRNKVVEVKFNYFLDHQIGPLYLSKMVRLFKLKNLVTEDMVKVHREILEAENKTKSAGHITIDRNLLWTDEAITKYNNSNLIGFERLVNEIGL